MQKKISIFSFFSGIGILDLAFEKNGYNIVFVNEYDNLFIESYRYARMQMNLRAPIYGYRNDSAERYARRRGKKNLLALIAQEREKGNLVGFIGGPPCPDFSVAGKNAGVDGENGRLTKIYFLGNKESDWIKLQQFRTKGQQWYRFDLGNTVGYVSLADAGQNHIQEISSRLDISANETSEAFKLLINVVFNYLFYDLNRKANDLVKTLLAEEGLLEENLSKRVKKNDAALREMMRRNKRMQKALADVSEHLRRGTQISGTDQVALPQQSYAFLTAATNTRMLSFR